MSNNKIQINIVYKPGKSGQKKIYENEKGVIWHSNAYDPKKNNIGMGWYSIPKPKPQDCLLAIEPYCILPKDYDPNFAKKFRHIFTFTQSAFRHQLVKKKTTQIKHPCWHTPPNIDELSKGWLPWEERRDEIVFVANNKGATHESEIYGLRRHLADLLYHKSKFKVSWYGQMEMKKPYYKGLLKSKQELLTKVKFSVCTENSYDPTYTQNYFTEKMPEVWKAGCVPIYMGCYNIDQFKFFEHSYIDLRSYVKKVKKTNNVNYQPFFGRLNGFDAERYNAWSKKLKNSIFKSGKLFDLVSYGQMYDTMINTLSKG